MIYVVATIEIAAGRRDEYLAVFRANLPNVLAEDGCVEYAPVVDFPTNLAAQPPVRPDVVTVIEKWRDPVALQAHLAAPHMAVYRTQVKHLVQRSTLHVFEPAK